MSCFRVSWSLNSVDHHTGVRAQSQIVDRPSGSWWKAAGKSPLVGCKQAKLQHPGDSWGQQQAKQQASHTPTVGRSLSHLVSLVWEGGKVLTSSHLECWLI